MPHSETIQVETTELSPAVRSLRVQVAASEVDQAFDRSYKELGRTVRVKGFRKGKIPRSMIEKMYGESVAEEIERMLVSQTLPDAVEMAEVTPISEPDIQAGRPERGVEFEYTATVEVRPPIELPDLSAIKGERLAVSVSDEDVDGELEQLRDRQARLVEEPEEVEATEGHTLTVDFVGRMDGEVFEGGKGEGVELELGSGRMIPGFEDQLVGSRSGDDVEVNVTFPEEYQAEHLAGKQATFDVHVAAIRRREVPELDDEFAKDVGDFETLEELRDRIREGLTERRLQASEEGLKRSVMNALIEATAFDVPPGVVERQLHSEMNSMKRRFEGQVPEEFLRQELARMHEEGRPNAERRVRESFLLSQLAEDRGIEISDDDVDGRLDEMAESQGMESKQIRAMAEQQGWREAIRAELLDQRALDFLIAQATVEEIAEAPEPDSP